MPLAAIDLLHLLAAVVAMRPALFGRLHRLTVDNGRAGRRIASVRSTHALAEDAVHTLPDAGPPPRAKIGEDRGPGTVFAWHIPPGAARPQEVEDAVENPPQIDAAGTPSPLGAWEQGFEQGPFTIAEVTGIHT
jgi:hypothetical protein